MDRRIAVVLHDSLTPGAPTIDVIDDGIGIHETDFPSTILSLQRGNKIQQLHLIGAFGQGGASTLSFCEYAIIISRHAKNPQKIAFTVVRVIKLDDTWKEDCYAFLGKRLGGGAIAVPSCSLQGNIPLYPSEYCDQLPQLNKGTLVRHISYRLSGLDGQLGPSPGNLYHYFHVSFFDPLFPFRIVDLRVSSKKSDELVTGSRNRLMKLVHRESHRGKDETGSIIRHYRPMEYVVPHGGVDPAIGIEYWVVLNYRKGRGVSDAPILRSESNELFVQKGFPIIGTLNGQNQGEIRSKLLRDIGLAMVSRHLIVNIDATLSDSRVRRELFATNREGFKDGPVLDGVLKVLSAMLSEDKDLHAIERELTERLARRESETTRDEVKRRVIRLLRDAGFQPRESGPTNTRLGEEYESATERAVASGGRTEEIVPLQTLPFPEVSRFEIVSPKKCLRVRVDGVAAIRVETDADAEYDVRGAIGIRAEPSSLEVASKSPLRHGRMSWRFRAGKGALPGDVGSIVAAITRPNGTQMTATIPFEVLAATEATSRQARGVIPPFDIIPINPMDEQERWEAVWPQFGVDTEESRLARVAYRAVPAGGGITVYYSTIFRPYIEQLRKMQQKSPALAELFTTDYEIWIGYHALLQYQSGISAEIDTELVESLFEEDRVRVATMQAKQASYTAELRHNAMRGKDAD